MPKAVKYTKGSIIYFSGDKDDRVFILQSGIVILTTHDIESNSQITEQVKTGEFFGVKSALGHFPREETATVLTDSIVITMNVAEFETLFSSKKDVIIKMLRVFSHQLRMVHKKIESILHNSEEINQASGMLSVAKSFYNDEQYRSCCDVCIKLLTRCPNSELKETVAKLYADSKLRYDKTTARKHRTLPAQNAAPAKGALKQFSLPAFERFAKMFEPEQVIISEFEPGDCFYLIQSGEVQLVKCVNGAKKNLDILKPGEFFGEMAILDNSPRSATCVAINQVELLEFNKENFQSLIAGNPQIALILLKLFCKRIYDQKRRLNILVISDLQARIADVFVMYDEMNPVQNTEDRSRKFNLTIASVAHWAGLTPEVAREEINKFIEKRKLEVFENYMIVSNITDMKRIVDTKSVQKTN
ncbi:Crp/Fnr family transcriptional regulator [Treponema parvum]|uniref:Crp/Fnr family transcriptional regulator n=1 Tax=Treponema parvum TaxID=138851 RepID=A0A975ID44_9SPIR|nr:Crp/Fnr family transcriptional regulator [Treponema parvum]QTQ12447.1 Crp/Fnr family transcriptional regulator [Treponema parvum]